MRDAGTLETYVPVDISEEITRRTAAELVARVRRACGSTAIVCDYETHLERVPREEGALIAFLGGTIGNFRPAPRRSFLARIATLMYPGDRFLLGTDLVKDRGSRSRPPTTTPPGSPRSSTRTCSRVLNRELGADFDLDAFEHVAFWDAENVWIDIRLRSLAEQFIDVRALDMRVHFARNEEMRTEISTKFTRERLEASYADAGLELVEWWTDPDGLFALSLRADRSSRGASASISSPSWSGVVTGVRTGSVIPPSTNSSSRSRICSGVAEDERLLDQLPGRGRGRALAVLGRPGLAHLVDRARRGRASGRRPRRPAP